MVSLMVVMINVDEAYAFVESTRPFPCPRCSRSNSSALWFLWFIWVIWFIWFIWWAAQTAIIRFHPPFVSGWGDTGIQETSTDRLQETVVPIVETSNCEERMNQAEGVDENLIVCAGGAKPGPCKVRHKIINSLILKDTQVG